MKVSDTFTTIYTYNYSSTKKKLHNHAILKFII